jgi:energy-coupling factor transport system ATP-binding protein
VRDDPLEIMKNKHIESAPKTANITPIISLCRLEDLLDRHPYDLSGGEQQRAALAKVLLLDPDILLMDEPTKGLDAEFKQVFAEITKVLLHRGVTILMVSHDIEFCAKNAHQCALFFDGTIVTQAEPHEFFSGNSFYTTSANRMSRSLLPAAITDLDVIAACGGVLPPVLELPDIGTPYLPLTKNNPEPRCKKLPWWRRIIAAVAAVVVAVLFVNFMGVSDLSSILTGELNPGSGATETYIYRIYLLIAALLVLAAAIGRRSQPTTVPVQIPKEKRKLSKRTVAATIAILLLIPLTLYIGIFFLGGKKYYFIALMVMLECMLPFFLVFEGRKPQARELVIIAVLCAIGVAGRAALFMLPQFKPVMALVIIAGVAFGGETGFLVGAMTMLASNVLFSQGPWTPWQMFAMGITGFLAGLLFRKGLLRRTRVSLCVFGGLAAIIIYGGIMNPASALMWSNTLNWSIILTYYISGFPMDLVHAAGTVVFLWFAAEPMLEKLDRIKVKYGLVE